jgi:very-short-patch-repair endonuclease
MPKQLALIARTLRNGATDAERRFWYGVKRQQIGGFKFRRQVVLKDFVVDFACLEARLVIEVDGATHSTDAELMRDAARTRALRSEGYDILRFTNEEAFGNLDGVLETVRLKLIELRPRLQDEIFEGGATPLPNPPPQGGRERGERLAARRRLV